MIGSRKTVDTLLGASTFSGSSFGFESPVCTGDFFKPPPSTPPGSLWQKAFRMAVVLFLARNAKRCGRGLIRSPGGIRDSWNVCMQSVLCQRSETAVIVAPHVLELRKLLGDDVLLLAWPSGT